jgi:serine/threonine protein kinase
MNPNSWQFNRQELNTFAMSLHIPTQRLGWGRRLYRFEVAGQGYWLKYQSLSEHAALINGFDAELSFYQHALAMLQLPKFLPEVQILENFELHSEQVKVALILKNVPSLLMANPHQLSRDHVIHIIFKMLNAVEELHQMGWIHADLKASHFLLDGSTCKLIDFEQSREVDPLQRYPGVGESEQWQDQEGAPGVQHMLQMLEWRCVTLAVEGDHEAHDDPRQGRMDTGLEHGNPEHQAD